MPPKKVNLNPHSPPPSYSFHGSNSSHSKDNGYGGRTYHIPNYATSYANDRSRLISIKFDEDTRTPRAIITVILIFLLFAAVSLFILPLRFSQVMGPAITLPERSQPAVRSPDRYVDIDPSTRKGTDWTEPSPQLVCTPGDADCSANFEPAEQAAEWTLHKNKKSGNAYWDDPKATKRCSGFGAREYKARLWNLHFFSNWTRACRETEIEIHGVVFPTPAQCDSKWPFGGVTGHWVVDVLENDCLAHWGKVADKGCINNRLKRFQSRLHNVKSKEDRMSICLTAPAVIQGKRVPTPTSCNDQGIWGVYGIWDLEDQSC